MLRLLYRIVLRLHPREFRRRYAEEMLWIFDQEPRTAELRLLADGATSLARQWVLRPGRGEQAAAAVEPMAGAPTFRMVEQAPLGARAALQGLALACVSFGLIGLILAHGAPSGAIHLPHVLFPSSNAPLPRETPGAAARRAARQQAARDIVMTFLSLDANGDGVLSAREIEPNAAERMRAILLCADADGDGAIYLPEFARAVELGEVDCATPSR